MSSFQQGWASSQQTWVGLAPNKHVAWRNLDACSQTGSWRARVRGTAVVPGIRREADILFSQSQMDARGRAASFQDDRAGTAVTYKNMTAHIKLWLLPDLYFVCFEAPRDATQYSTPGLPATRALPSPVPGNSQFHSSSVMPRPTSVEPDQMPRPPPCPAPCFQLQAWFGDAPIDVDDLVCRICGRPLYLVAQV